MTDQKLPSVRVSIILAMVLLLPYLLKLLYSEPYPAIILPSGHTTLRVSDSTYCAPARVLYAVDRNTLEYRSIPADSFLSPAPVRLLAYWERNHFGLAARDKNTSSTDSISIDEMKFWYKIKLNKLGFLADHFKMVNQLTCFSRESKKVVEERIVKENIYELD